MKELLKKLQLWATITTISEIVLLGTFVTLYYFNVWGMQDTIPGEVVSYLCVFLLCVNFICYSVFTVLLYKNRQKTNIRLATLLGNDVFETYLFANLGFIVINEEDKVIFVSDKLKDKDFNIINRNVYEWCPKLKELNTEEDIKEDKIVEISNFSFRVKFLNHSGLIIFQDVTNNENALKLYQNGATCLAFIMIDNYQELASNNEEINEVIPMIKSEIVEYAKKYNIVLRSYKNDSYFALMRYEDYKKIEKDNFSILNSIRILAKKEEANVSLSIGISFDFPSLTQLNEMATSALNVAMSRGGDQVVVAQMNSELKFFGGSSETSESRNKVKVKSDANSLLNYISQADDKETIIIMGHSYMDMDCLGTCLGLQSLCDYKNKKSQIVYDPNITESKTRGAISSQFKSDEFKRRFISPKEAMEITNPRTLLLIGDVNNPSQFMCKDIAEKTEKIIIVDHHRRGDKFVENILLPIIETSASSASELVAEIIKYGSKYPPIVVPSKVATIMLSGILLDTNYFKTKTVGERTYEACQILKSYGGDNQKADDLLKDEFEEYSAVASLVATQQTYDYGIVYCCGKEDEVVEQANIAKACNICVGLKNVQAAFTIAKISPNDVKMSARSDGSINVQIVCEKLGGPKGSGGGRFSASAVVFKNATIESVKKELIDTLDSLRDEIKTKGD